MRLAVVLGALALAAAALGWLMIHVAAQATP